MMHRRAIGDGDRQENGRKYKHQLNHGSRLSREDEVGSGLRREVPRSLGGGMA